MKLKDHGIHVKDPLGLIKEIIQFMEKEKENYPNIVDLLQQQMNKIKQF